MSFGDLPISASPVLRLQMHVTKPGFFFNVGVKDPNSDPHVYTFYWLSPLLQPWISILYFFKTIYDTFRTQLSQKL